MNDGSQFIDIILFAMVAVFLGLRLRSVLGRRTGTEKAPPPAGVAAPAANVVDLQRHRPAAMSVTGNPAIDEALAAIAAADQAFTIPYFRTGAIAAFEMVVAAFAAGDETGLRPLLADEVFENFARAIRARRAAGEICYSKLVAVNSADFADARLDGRIATVSMRFVSEQIILVKDAEGKVVEGDAGRPARIVDLWSFSRDVRSTNPNWLLVSTRSLDE